jgi:hypothetical protein
VGPRGQPIRAERKQEAPETFETSWSTREAADCPKMIIKGAENKLLAAGEPALNNTFLHTGSVLENQTSIN